MQNMQPFFLVALLQRADINSHMRSADISNINNLYNEAINWQDAGEPLHVDAPTEDKTIVVLNLYNHVIDERKGEWNKQTYDAIKRDNDLEYKFKDWGKPYATGNGWTLYSCDVLLAVVVDAGFDVKRSVAKAIEHSI